MTDVPKQPSARAKIIATICYNILVSQLQNFVVLKINNHSLIVHLQHLAIFLTHLVNAELITVSQNKAEVAKQSK